MNDTPSSAPHPKLPGGFKARLGASGVHLYSRQTGLNVLLDEAKVPSDQWSNAPRHVSVALTNDCDLHCSFCYAPKVAAKLDFEKLSCWLADLDAEGALGVGFGGGEPTLYPRFAELCVYLNYKTKLAVSMTTHGHHLTDTLLDQLEGSVQCIRVSIDGVGKRYESLRGRSFTQLVERLEAMKGRFFLGINTVVNADTLNDMDALADLAELTGAKQFLLLPERPARGRPGVDIHTINALRVWASNYRGPVELAISEADGEGFQTCDPLAKEPGLRGYVHIDAKGFMKRSSFDAEGIKIGDGGVLNALAKLRTDLQES